mgnify:CR=1 FL=1
MAYSGCQKNVPFFEGFFLQPLIPSLYISELIFEKRYKSADRYSAAIFVLNFFHVFDYIYFSISSLKLKFECLYKERIGYE